MYFYNKVLKVESVTNIHSEINKNISYKSFDLTVNGKVRGITSIDKKTNLYLLQRNLLDNFLSEIKSPDNVCGFVKGKSYLDFLKPHCKKEYYLRLDIKDFFGSIKVSVISEVLKEYIQTPDQIKNKEILNVISNIVTYNRKLPQGAVTSPQISNIIFRRLDIRIRNYCRKFDINYTRYADDILFSSNLDYLHKESFYKMIYKILSTLNLKINKSKVIKSKKKIILNGYVISEKIHLSRKKLCKINTYIFSFENFAGKKKYPISFDEFENRLSGSINRNITKIGTIHYLAGYRSYLINFSKERYRDSCNDYSDKVLKIEMMLDKILKF